jgi:dTDP-4-amino-4,6-dideoxygalactose transaminase
MLSSSRARVASSPPAAPAGGAQVGTHTSGVAGKPRIYLSSPHIGSLEQALVADVFASNWLAPIGPHVDAFEREFCAAVGAKHAAAVSSGTAALHLALRLANVGPGDDVFVSTLTFAASANPICYLGATPVFIDSERVSWNMDPVLVREALEIRARTNRPPKAIVVVHLYGQTADLSPILDVCASYGVAVIEDAAEALGADYNGRAAGTLGKAGIYSFNGNKIVTTAGGGMLVSDDEALVTHARKLASQARDPAPHYEHSELGYNYRLSNVLAAIGRAQLAVLEERVAARRRNFIFYRDQLADLPGVEFMPEASWGRHTRWLTCLTVDEKELGVDRETLRLALESENIEARPVWKPLHLQPLFSGCERIGGAVAEDIFHHGLCLPSGSNLTAADLERVVSVIRRTVADARSRRTHTATHRTSALETTL